MSIKSMATMAALAAVLLLSACGGGGTNAGVGASGGGIGGTGSPVGTLSFSLTDAPACGYDAVHLTIEKILVHQGAAASDTDSGWSELVLNPAKRVDLLTLTNGVLESLGQISLPAGNYTQLRLVLAANDASHPFANSVLPTGGVETALTTPSAQQSGIKLKADIDVPAGEVVDVALDFDACKSIVKRGNSGQYNLKPVVSIIPIVSAAGLRVVGYVDRSIALGTTNVSAQLNGVPVKASPPDATGRFVLYPVPIGSYDLVVSSPGHATAVVTGVPVEAATPTTVNSASMPITPPLAGMQTVTGTVTPATATVRALQSLSGGLGVEVAWGSVDPTSGVFAFALPIGAPVRASYASNLGLTFAADTPAASKFTLEGASIGVTKTQNIDVSSPVLPVTFISP